MKTGGRYRQKILERLFELHEQEMYRIAFSILHDKGQAEDAVMSAFERIGAPRACLHEQDLTAPGGCAGPS